MDSIEEKKQNDLTLLKVSGKNDKEYVKKLSNAILSVLSKHDKVTMRCCGAASVNNAAKAFVIAKGELQKGGTSIVLDAVFTTLDFDGEEMTGILFEVNYI